MSEKTQKFTKSERRKRLIAPFLSNFCLLIVTVESLHTNYRIDP